MRYRLRTLLIAMSWVGLVSLALRVPTPLWAGVIEVLTLLIVLLAVLVIIHRPGRLRTMAIGFLVFCVGYLAYLGVRAGTLSSGLNDSAMPLTAAFYSLYWHVHPDTDSLNAGTFLLRQPRPYDPREFVAICHYAVACILGVIGSIAAQLLATTTGKQSRE